MEFKVCKGCGGRFPLSLFSPDPRGQSGVKGKCKKCVAEAKRIWASTNYTKLMLSQTRARAKKLGREFNLTLADLVIPDLCPVLGIPLYPSVTGRRDRTHSPSIDRIDSSRGYTRDNIVIVSYRANVIKNNATPDELDRVASFYRQLTDR